MSTHIGAQPGQVAQHVLPPGDPLGAEWIASTYVADARATTGYAGPGH